MSEQQQDAVVPVEQIAPCIAVIRGQRVMLDADVAKLYGVPRKRLIEQVKRNRARFPGDFAWQLTVEDVGEVVADCDYLARRKFSRARHYAFTENGVIMAASVLNTPRAMKIRVYVVRTSLELRKLLSADKSLRGRIAAFERRLAAPDVALQSFMTAIQRLMEPPPAAGTAASQTAKRVAAIRRLIERPPTQAEMRTHASGDGLADGQVGNRDSAFHGAPVGAAALPHRLAYD